MWRAAASGLAADRRVPARTNTARCGRRCAGADRLGTGRQLSRSWLPCKGPYMAPLVSTHMASRLLGGLIAAGAAVGCAGTSHDSTGGSTTSAPTTTTPAPEAVSTTSTPPTTTSVAQSATVCDTTRWRFNVPIGWVSNRFAPPHESDSCSVLEPTDSVVLQARPLVNGFLDFQAGYAGSIPVTRSPNTPGQRLTEPVGARSDRAACPYRALMSGQRGCQPGVSRVSAGCRTAGCRTVPLGGAASRAERRDRVQRLDACAPGVAAPAALDRSDMFASRPAARERDFSPSLGAACVVASTAWTFGRLDR